MKRVLNLSPAGQAIWVVHGTGPWANRGNLARLAGFRLRRILDFNFGWGVKERLAPPTGGGANQRQAGVY